MSTLEFSSKPAAAIPDPRTILLVEDESMVREITCTVLESAGYSVKKRSVWRRSMPGVSDSCLPTWSCRG